METNLLIAAQLVMILTTRMLNCRPAKVAYFVARLCEFNEALYKLAPTGSKEAGGYWHKEESRLYTDAQNLVTVFASKSGIPMGLFYNADIPLQIPGSRLRLEIPNSGHDESNPLYVQADVAKVALSTTDEMAEEKYAHKTEILLHRIGFNVWGEGSEEIDELDAGSSDHIESMIRDNFSEGELTICGKDGGICRGYWAIL